MQNEYTDSDIAEFNSSHSPNSEDDIPGDIYSDDVKVFLEMFSQAEEMKDQALSLYSRATELQKLAESRLYEYGINIPSGSADFSDSIPF